MPRINPLDAAWEDLFNRLGLLARVRAEGVVRMTSDELGNASQPLLMKELEHSGQLPAILRRSGMSLLSLGPDKWAVGLIDTHRPLCYDDVRPQILPATDLVSLDQTRLCSTDNLLRLCLCTGIFDRLMGGRAWPTAGGRMESGPFSFRVRDAAYPTRYFTLEADHVNAGVDCILESEDALCLCAVCRASAPELPIRRLYYPYRLWRERTDKQIIPLFVVHTGGIIHLFSWTFSDPENFNSLTPVSHCAYTQADQSLTVAQVRHLWQQITPLPEPDLPFPQADTFDRIVDLLCLLRCGETGRDILPLRCETDPRQADYYIHACQYLGLVEYAPDEEGMPVDLTDEGRRIMDLPWRQRYLALMGCILQRPVFHRAFGRALQLGDVPNKDLVIRIMMECGLPLNETTMTRRASTVRGWMGWILDQCGGGTQLSLL